MVLIALSGQRFNLGKNALKRIGQTKIPVVESVAQEEEITRTTEPDPAMTNITKDTTVDDLGVYSGQGFSVKGGSMKPANEKLRKFISLKIK